MPEKIHVTIDVQVVGGPKLSVSLEQEVEAYDKIQVSVEKNATNKEVELQPSSSSGQVKFLMISLTDSNNYGDQVTYKVNSSDPSAQTIPLDAPQVLIGAGGVKMLLDAPPQSLFFTNNLNEDISVQILVGRDATPPPPP